MARFVPLAQLVYKAAVHVPCHDTGKVLAHFAGGRVSQLRALLVLPGADRGIGRIRNRLVSLEHPFRNGAEIQHQWMSFRDVHHVFGHRVNVGKIPRGFGSRGRIELQDAEVRIDVSSAGVSNVIRSEIRKGLGNLVVERRLSPHVRRCSQQ